MTKPEQSKMLCDSEAAGRALRASKVAPADIADAMRSNLLTALDDLSGAMRALSPGARFPVATVDLSTAGTRADAAAYYLGLAIGQVDQYNRDRMGGAK